MARPRRYDLQKAQDKEEVEKLIYADPDSQDVDLFSDVSHHCLFYVWGPITRNYIMSVIVSIVIGMLTA